MKYEECVVCPDPDCRWVAVVTIDTENPAALDPSGELDQWRRGIVRDALGRARIGHVIEQHVVAGQRS